MAKEEEDFLVMPKTVAAAPLLTPEVPAPKAPAEGDYVVLPKGADKPSPFWSGAKAGATLEFDDEIAGLLGYDKEAYRKQKQVAADISPGWHTAGKFAGGLASTLVPGGAIARAAGLGVRGAIAAGGIGGAAAGGTEAMGEYQPKPGEFSTAEMLGRGATGAAVGGATGAVAGPLLYGAGVGVRAGGRVLYDAMTDSQNPALRKTAQALMRQGTDPQTLADRLLHDAPPSVRNTPPETLALVLRGYQAGQSATQISGNLRMQGHALSPQQVGAINARFNRATEVPRDLIALSEEVGGGEAGRSGLTNLMQGVTTIGGRGREIAMRNMGATMETSPRRIAQRLERETGSSLQFRQQLGAREEARRTAANQAYGDAYADDYARMGGLGLPGQLEPIMTGYALQAQRLGGQTGSMIQQAVEIMSGIRPGSTQFGINSLERFHQARRTLDQAIRGWRSTASPDNNALRIIRNMRDELNRSMYATHPLLEAADRRFASDMAREEAMRIGRQMNFRSGEKTDELLDEIRGMERRNPEHAEELRDLFMQGMLRKIGDEVEISGGVPARWVQPHTGGIRPAPREALGAALSEPLPAGAPGARAVRGQPAPHLPGRETAEGVSGVLEDEARLRKIFTDIWSNSKTAERLAAQQDVRELPGIAAELASGGIFGTLRRQVSARLAAALTERNNEQIARIVTETDPRVLYLALQDMQRMGPRMRGGDVAIQGPATGAALGFANLLTGQ